MELIIRIVIFVVLIIASAFDIKKKEVPFVTILAVAAISVFSILYRIILGENVRGLVIAGIMGIVPGAVMIIISIFTKKAGIGDGLMLLGIGLGENYVCAITTACFGCFLLSLLSIVLLLTKKVTKNTCMPFVPFLAAGYVLWGVCYR